jgi:hypothetical protein
MLTDALRRAAEKRDPLTWPPSAEEILAVLDECDQLREALRPFADFAEHAVENTGNYYGWLSRIGHERICDWFGPTDFGEARAAHGPEVRGE